METLGNFMKNNVTCVIAIITFYDTNGKKPKIVEGVKLCPLFSHK